MADLVVRVTGLQANTDKAVLRMQTPMKPLDKEASELDRQGSDAMGTLFALEQGKENQQDLLRRTRELIQEAQKRLQQEQQKLDRLAAEAAENPSASAALSAQRTTVSAANAQLLALHAQLIQLMSQAPGVSVGRVDTTA
ncbi:hypothetical protein [Pseudomonas putida]|uniref:Uncharacterized protein n=1 Tax=Pseudomonas putida TaxID=303 RepID=A0A1Q9R555_PSEPU|nr:hypothetical protein [Pseudomonas putida]OLS62527.1 hypothetical protein PSEMO_24770 [Pseudomonas putida]